MLAKHENSWVGKLQGWASGLNNRPVQPKGWAKKWLERQTLKPVNATQRFVSGYRIQMIQIAALAHQAAAQAHTEAAAELGKCYQKRRLAWAT